MRTYVITGGTDGIGRGLGLHFLARGDRVVAVASGQGKGDAFLAEAERLGAADRARFLRADLSTLDGMRSVAAEVESTVDRLDGLVFGTQRFRPRREETPDGFEYTFALSYLSRFVLGHELAGVLDRAESPVVFNVAGSGGMPGRIDWDDPHLREGYTGMRAAMQASRCLDLLGVDFPGATPAPGSATCCTTRCSSGPPWPTRCRSPSARSPRPWPSSWPSGWSGRSCRWPPSSTPRRTRRSRPSGRESRWRSPATTSTRRRPTGCTG
ncbi:SDR family NAD(P)-dependent oxidoreductase [Nocardiopsis composta]